MQYGSKHTGKQVPDPPFTHAHMSQGKASSTALNRMLLFNDIQIGPCDYGLGLHGLLAHISYHEFSDRPTIMEVDSLLSFC